MHYNERHPSGGSPLQRPALDPGARLAHYDIIGRLGAGGMGEVYRAHDTVLGRPVALKILPPHVVRNEERLRRFVQEARAASSLNHPHIVTIYEIGETAVASGDGAAPLHYIAMELVDGVTLGAKIHDERVGLRTLIGFVAQAAEGLAKAHAAGIVHRDLKPDNIMVSADGFTKVLDFGLAKLAPSADGSDATRTRAVGDDTRDGVILGTVAYMSPEQVQGRTADHRSDIFAMGAILYEAATRRRPFAADSDVEVMHRILRDKPEPIADLNPAVPAELRRTIRRCLAKEPERRFQSMKDLAIELAEIVDEYDELAAAASSGSGSTIGMAAASPARAGGPSMRVVAGAAVLALVVIATAGYLWTRSRTPASPVSFGTMRMESITASGDVTEAAISPDGKFVAYVTRAAGRSAIWMHQVATGSRTALIPAQDAPLPRLIFSPDGSYLYYTRADEQRGNFLFSWLYAVPTLGGPSRKVVFDVDTDPAFSPDGSRLAFGRGLPRANENSVVVVNADGSGERTIATFPRVADALTTAWTPDGGKVVTSFVEMSPEWRAVAVEIDVASGAQRRLTGPRLFWMDDLRMLPDASAVLMVAADSSSARNQVWLQPYPEGTPVRVTNDLSSYDGLSLTQDGSVMAAKRVNTTFALGIVDPAAREHGQPLVASIDRGGGDDIGAAPNGTIAFSALTRGAGPAGLDISVLDPGAATPRLVTRGGENFGPTLTADGRTIVFWREASDAPARVYAVDIDGSNLRPLTEGNGESFPDISADGRMLLYTMQNRREIWVRPTAGGQARKLTDNATPAGARLSPDGRLAFFLEWTDAAHTAEHLKVVPVDGGAPVLDVAVRSARDLRWHPRGDAVTFLRSTGGVTNIHAIAIEGGAARQLTNFERGVISTFAWIDEQRLALLSSDSRSDVVLISNWRR